MTGSANVGVHGEEEWRKDGAMKGTISHSVVVRDVFPQPHMLPPVKQVVGDHLQVELSTYSWERLS